MSRNDDIGLHLCIEKLQSACSNNYHDHNNEAIQYPATMMISYHNLYTEVIKTHPTDLGRNEK